MDREADSLLALKANHGNDYAAVRSHFERHCFGRGATVRLVLDAFGEGHGRLVRRRVFADPRAASLETLNDWPRLKTVLAVETIRSVDGSNQVEAEIRDFLSSFAGDPSILAQAIRRHGSIENHLHWVLDVTFREDDCRIRDAIAARNFALLRKIAINLLTQDRSTQASLRGKRKKAAWDDNYSNPVQVVEFPLSGCREVARSAKVIQNNDSTSQLGKLYMLQLLQTHFMR